MLIEDGTYFVVEADGELIARGGWTRGAEVGTESEKTAVGMRILDPDAEPARVRLMFVRADWTRRGLDTQILKACEAAAKAEGYRRLVLMASLPGERLHVRYGFREVERVDIPLPDGRTIASVSMRKPID